jgi:TetR/AcrR family transcriptional regulator
MTDTATVTVMEVPNESSRDQILDSAIKVFSQKGFGGTRLREVAEHAGISHAMIKYYFGNKEHLWRAAVDFLFERQSRELRPTVASARDGNAKDILRVAIEQMVRYSARHPEHARLVMQASLTPSPHLDWILTHLRKVHGLFHAKLGDNDIFDTPDINMVAMHYLIYGACHTVFMLEHEARGVYGIDVTSPDFIDRFVQLTLDVLAPAILQMAEKFSKAGTGNPSMTSMGAPEVHAQETDDALELRIVIPKLPTPRA